MGYSLKLRKRDGSYVDVALPDDQSARLHLRFEGPNQQILADDLSLDLDNTDGWWTANLTPLDPKDAYPDQFGLQVLRDGSVRWEGDLNYDAVRFDSGKDRVHVQALDPLKRCSRKNAEAVKRDFTGIAIVSGTAHTRTLEVNSVLDTGGEPLAEGDVIRLGHYKPVNNKLQQADMEVQSVDIPTNVITFKRKLKFALLPGDAITIPNPWFRNKTTAWLVGKLLDQVPGFEAANRVVNYTAYTNDNVDMADFEGSNVAQAIEKLGMLVNAVPYVRIVSGVPKFYFTGRDLAADGDAVKALDSLVGDNVSVQPVAAQRYDLVVVKGRDKRYARRGYLPYGGKKLDIELPFIRDHVWLQAVCDRLYDFYARYRKKVDKFPVADDGTEYTLKKRVSYGGVTYFVTDVGQSLQDDGVQELGLLEDGGTLPDPGVIDLAGAIDDGLDPPEPLNLIFTKTYSSTFNTLFPADKYPRVVMRPVVIDEGPPPEIQMRPRRLFELSWEYPYDEIIHLVWRFEVRIWADGGDPGKPAHRLAVAPDIQSNGRYYAKIRVLGTKIWWADVIARYYDVGREGVPSDENNSTADDDVDPTMPSDPVLSSISSAIEDIPGTPGKECTVTVNLTLSANTPKDRVRVFVENTQAGSADFGRVYSETVKVGYADTAVAVPFRRKFLTGDTGKVTRIEVIYQSTVKVFDITPPAGNFTAGSKPAAPGAPALVRDETKRRRNLYSSTWTSNTELRWLRVFKRPYSASPGTPDSDAANWKMVKRIPLADEQANGTLSCTRTAAEFGVQHQQDQRICVAIQSVDTHHQKSPWTVDTGAVPSDTDDTAPAVPVIGTLQSYEKDKPGTRRVDCDLAIPLTFSGCDEIEVSVADAFGGHTRTHGVGGLTFYTFYFARAFDRGDTLGVAVRGKKGTAWSAWSGVSNIVAGSSTGTAPAGPSAPELTVLQRGPNKTRLRVAAASGDSAATKKALTFIQVFTAKRWSATTPSPDSWESAVGGSTAVGSGYLEDNSADTPITANDQYNGGTLIDSAGIRFYIEDTVLSTKRYIVSGTPAAGNYVIEPVWEREDGRSIEESARNGKKSWRIVVHHKDLDANGIPDKPAIAVQLCSNISTTPSAFSYIEAGLDVDMTVDVTGAQTVDCAATGIGGTAPYTYAWDFGDGATDTGSAVSHAYLEPGPYVITCTVTDAVGNTASQESNISMGGNFTSGGARNATVAVSTSTLIPPDVPTNGMTAWSNPGNAADSGGDTYATCAVAARKFSEGLKLTGYGFTLPTGSPNTFKGIKVTVHCKSSNANDLVDHWLQLTYNGALIGVKKTLAESWPTIEGARVYGNAADKWYTNLNNGLINNASFGVVIGVFNQHTSSSRTASVDNIEIEPFYDDGT